MPKITFMFPRKGIDPAMPGYKIPNQPFVFEAWVDEEIDSRLGATQALRYIFWDDFRAQLRRERTVMRDVVSLEELDDGTDGEFSFIRNFGLKPHIEIDGVPVDDLYDWPSDAPRSA